MSTDAQPIASSPMPPPVPAPPPATPTPAQTASGDVAAFREARRAERLEALRPSSSPSLADSAPAEPDATSQPAPGADTATAPAPKRGGAEERKAQLDADIQARLKRRHEVAQEIAREEGRLAALRAQSQPQDVKPPAPSPGPAVAQDDPEPQLTDYEADPAKYPDPYSAWMRSVGRWEARQEYRQQEQARHQREQAERQAKTAQEREAGFRSKLTEATKADPAFIESLSPDVLALKPFSKLGPGDVPSALNAVAEEIVSSDNPTGLMRYFSDHPEALQRCAGMVPAKLFRELGRIEASLAGATSAPTQTITNAPRPPTTLGSQPAQANGSTDAAAQRGDVSAFFAARRREKLARAGLTR